MLYLNRAYSDLAIIHKSKTSFNEHLLTKDVLDHGFVRVEDWIGSDLTVVNSARVSFNNRKTALDESDVKLIRYLAKHKHYSPFRHLQVQFHIKAPEFVMRQWYKHVVGIEWTSAYATKDHAWNEMSRRYVEVQDFYIPEIWRTQSDSNKQASQYDENGNPIVNREIQEEAEAIAILGLNDITSAIGQLISLGVAKEQAQILLPLNFYTEIYWTASFQAIANFIELRDAPDAQWEIRQYAKVLKHITEKLYPETTKAWLTKKEY